MAAEFSTNLSNVSSFVKDVVIPNFLQFLETLGLINRRIEELTLTELKNRIRQVNDELDEQRRIQIEYGRSVQAYNQGIARAAEERIPLLTARLKELKTALEEAQKPAQTAITQAGLITGGIDPAAATPQAEAAREAERNAARIEQLRQSFLTEREVLIEQFNARQALIDQAVELRTLKEHKADALRIQAAQQLENELTAINQKGLRDRAKFQETRMVKKLMRPVDGSISINRPNVPDNKPIDSGKSMASK